MAAVHDVQRSAAMSKRLPLALRWAVITAIVTGLLCLAPLLDDGFRYEWWQNAALVGAVAVFGGLVSAGLLYLGYVARSLRSLQVAWEDLGAVEQVLKQTRASIVHYRNGNPCASGRPLGASCCSRVCASFSGRTRVSRGADELVIPLTEVIEAARRDPGPAERPGRPLRRRRERTVRLRAGERGGMGVGRQRGVRHRADG